MTKCICVWNWYFLTLRISIFEKNNRGG